MIRVEELSFSYNRHTQNLSGINLAVSQGEVLGVIGPNGAGKSTLIRCLNRILTPQKGCIRLNGQDIKTYSRKKIANLMGYVPQKQSSVFSCKVLEVVMAGLGKTWNRTGTMEQAKVALQALQRLNMGNLALRDFESLSGGEQQKVVIARVIASRAKIMLFDEPTSSLDIRYQFETLRLIRQIVKKKEHSAVIAIHDLNMAMGYCDRILLLDKGKMRAFGRPDEVMTGENIRDTFKIKVEFITNNDHKILILKDAI